MKNVFAIGLMMAFFVTVLFAQHDVSYWNRSAFGENLGFPWYTYFGEYAVDLRYNFDQKETGGMLFGKPLKVSEYLTIVPMMGGLVGKYTGITPQLYLMGGKGRLSFFSQHQFVKGVGQEHNDYQYHWIDVLGAINKHVALGVDCQVYNEPKIHFTEHDIGPSAKITFPPIKMNEKKFLVPYIKGWLAKSVGPSNDKEKLIYVALGATF